MGSNDGATTEMRTGKKWLVRLMVCAVIWMAWSGSARAQLECWIPTRVQDTTLPQAKGTKGAAMLRALRVADDVLHRNTYYRQLPEPNRIRTTISAGGGYLNCNTYKKSCWTPGKCDVIQGADRGGCRIAGIHIGFNEVGSLLSYRMSGDEKLQMFGEPKLTGKVAGYPEYDGINVVITKDGKLPWVPVTVGEYLDFMERRLQKQYAEFQKEKAEPEQMTDEKLQKAYETMKQINPKEADKYLSDMKKIRKDAAEQRVKMNAEGEARFQKEFGEFRAYRASLSSQQLQSQAHSGSGFQGLAKTGDREPRGVVKINPLYQWDENSDGKLRMAQVFVSVVETDTDLKRKNILIKTKETIDYAALAALLD